MRCRRHFGSSSSPQAAHRTRHLIIGGGVTVLVERHPRFGEETSSRNSEVIHAGIYYPPNSLKTRLCIRGKDLLYKFADEVGVPYKRCGKWLIAHNDQEGAYLEKMRVKCADLGVHLQWLPRETIACEEPLLRARDALFSPTTGIIDSHSLMSALETGVQANEGIVAYGTEVVSITKQRNGYLVETGPEPCVFEAEIIVNAAGLSASKIARMLIPNLPLTYETFFCKGHYFSYSGKPLVKRLIYPVPEKNLAGLGVHATVDLAGRMRFGPDTLYIDTPNDYSVNSGMQLEQVCAAVRTYLPSVEKEKFYPDYAGIRPKLSRKGEEARDFLITHEVERGLPGIVNLLGIESPGLTSSLAIAEHIAGLLGYPQ